VCEVGHDGEARVGFGREVMAQKKFVTYFPDKEKRAYALALIKNMKKEGEKNRRKKLTCAGRTFIPRFPVCALGIIL
jgi:hypothetical protein